MKFAATSPVSSYEGLGVKPGCGVAALKEVWRGLASKHHPDKGGDSETFSKIRSMYSIVLAEETALEAICKLCNGTGVVWMGNGFGKMQVTCHDCGGVSKFSK